MTTNRTTLDLFGREQDGCELVTQLLRSAERAHDLGNAQLSFRAALEAINDMISNTVLEARLAGLSWAEIGVQLNVSRQAAHKRYGHLDDLELD